MGSMIPKEIKYNLHYDEETIHETVHENRRQAEKTPMQLHTRSYVFTAISYTWVLVEHESENRNDPSPMCQLMYLLRRLYHHEKMPI